MFHIIDKKFSSFECSEHIRRIIFKKYIREALTIYNFKKIIFCLKPSYGLINIFSVWNLLSIYFIFSSATFLGFRLRKIFLHQILKTKIFNYFFSYSCLFLWINKLKNYWITNFGNFTNIKKLHYFVFFRIIIK